MAGGHQRGSERKLPPGPSGFSTRQPRLPPSIHWPVLAAFPTRPCQCTQGRGRVLHASPQAKPRCPALHPAQHRRTAPHTFCRALHLNARTSLQGRRSAPHHSARQRTAPHRTRPRPTCARFSASVEMTTRKNWGGRVPSMDVIVCRMAALGDAGPSTGVGSGMQVEAAISLAGRLGEGRCGSAWREGGGHQATGPPASLPACNFVSGTTPACNT